MSKSQVLTHAADQQVVLQLDKINKIFNADTPLQNHVLRDISLQVARGELVALVGTSGSGKSTLLNVMGLLDVSSSGELRIQGHLVQGMTEQQRTQLRSESIGFVFQFHHLISAFSVLDNVLMPLMLRYGKPSAEQVEYAEYLLSEMGLAKFSLFERFNVEHQCAIVIVTHDPRLSSRCPRTIRLSDGGIVYDGASADLPSLFASP